jgi:hypothetical protein
VRGGAPPSAAAHGGKRRSAGPHRDNVQHHGGSERLTSPRLVLKGCAEGTPRRAGAPPSAVVRGGKRRSAGPHGFSKALWR